MYIAKVIVNVIFQLHNYQKECLYLFKQPKYYDNNNKDRDNNLYVNNVNI